MPEEQGLLEKLVFHWTINKNYLLHSRLLKLLVREGRPITNVLETIVSGKLNGWPNSVPETLKMASVRGTLIKSSYKLLNYFFDKTLANVRHRLKIHFLPYLRLLIKLRSKLKKETDSVESSDDFNVVTSKNKDVMFMNFSTWAMPL